MEHGKKGIHFFSEDLAVPEVVVDDRRPDEPLQDEEDGGEEISYDNLAIPEIHVHHNKND